MMNKAVCHFDFVIRLFCFFFFFCFFVLCHFYFCFPHVNCTFYGTQKTKFSSVLPEVEVLDRTQGLFS